MNKAVKLTAIAAAVAVISACGADKKESVKLETEAQKQSYALGASMGRYLKNNLDQNADIGVNLDQTMIIGGIEDALGDKVQLNDEEIETIMTGLESQVRKLRAEKQEALAAEAQQAGKDFLAENAKRSEVTVTESGLQYEVLQEGEGEKPNAEDTVTVHYHGTLIDGSVFDSSVERGQTTSFPLNRVIPGWTEGLQYMSPGAKYKFYIPSELAYGARSAGSIPPNSTLIFEVELFEVEKPAVETR
ncbi:FKBP-type peptidyl-prolyl cis-trans isomerase [Psychrosphaera ytuae]|uniref:Peptidyl-prolyl cis-trans isomerase n=1 Tax=Psychrosphaera ytuae TaxID=2820710 RepID=A0A975DAE3_9GAMM|nr:FKBP-type peptidyl-prolyl cis-trans isomerase [Psychrosphaera ytuae]QTH63144.1 FKBP-type peptidyl-prolyl cis-trans isomerase [Psychrosphaera ytuae]